VVVVPSRENTDAASPHVNVVTPDLVASSVAETLSIPTAASEVLQMQQTGEYLMNIVHNVD